MSLLLLAIICSVQLAHILPTTSIMGTSIDRRRLDASVYERKHYCLYNIVEDRLMRNNVAGKHPEVQQAMERRIKALIQQYNNRLIDDELIP